MLRVVAGLGRGLRPCQVINPTNALIPWNTNINACLLSDNAMNIVVLSLLYILTCLMQRRRRVRSQLARDGQGL